MQYGFTRFAKPVEAHPALFELAETGSLTKNAAKIELLRKHHFAFTDGEPELTNHGWAAYKMACQMERRVPVERRN